MDDKNIDQEKFLKLLKEGWPVKTAAKTCNIPWWIARKIAYQNNIRYSIGEGLKRFKRLIRGYEVDFDPPQFTDEELIKALVQRAEYVFKVQFQHYNTIEREALCRIILKSLPKNLQERALAYVLTLIYRKKTTHMDIARIIHKHGLLQNIKISSVADLTRIWMGGANPLRLKKEIRFIKGKLEYFIGRALGDSSVPHKNSKRKGMYLYDKDRDSLEYAAEILKEMGVHCKLYKRTTRNTYSLYHQHVLLYYILRALRDSITAEEYSRFLTLSEDLAWSFVQGLADSEGSVSLNWTNFGDPCIRINIVNTKEHILKICQRALLENEIISDINYKNKEKTKIIDLVINNKMSILKCMEKQIFLMRYKKEKLENLISLTYNRTPPSSSSFQLLIQITLNLFQNVKRGRSPCLSSPQVKGKMRKTMLQA
ncbi:MAG: LAGLIDADG family homing endonuclease [Nitrososphaerota archaeon]|nr:LAGLIDADG family homing endonuclease [Nitrososphaerota archaeon]